MLLLLILRGASNMLSTTFINTSWQNVYPAILLLTWGTSFRKFFCTHPNIIWDNVKSPVFLRLGHSSALFSIIVCWHEKKTPVTLCMFCEVSY